MVERIALEDVGNEDVESVRRQFVREESSVDEGPAKYVGEIHDRAVLRRIIEVNIKSGNSRLSLISRKKEPRFSHLVSDVPSDIHIQSVHLLHRPDSSSLMNRAGNAARIDGNSQSRREHCTDAISEILGARVDISRTLGFGGKRKALEVFADF